MLRKSIACPQVLLLSGLLFAGLLFSGNSHAQYSGYYLELAGGPNDFEFDPDWFNESGSFGRVTVGFRFNDNIALELSYLDYDENLSTFEQEYIDLNDQTGQLESRLLPGSAEYSTQAYGAGIVAGLPWGRYFNFYVKGGFYQWKMDFEFRQEQPFGLVGVFDDEFNGTGLQVGAGVAFNVNLHFSIRAEYTYQDWSTSSLSEGVNVYSSSIAIRYNF